MSRLRKDSTEFRGEVFHYREWTPAERSQCLKRRAEDPVMFSAAVAFRCVTKADGTRLFAKEDDAAGEPAELIDDLAAKVLELSGVKIEDDEKKD